MIPNTNTQTINQIRKLARNATSYAYSQTGGAMAFDAMLGITSLCGDESRSNEHHAVYVKYKNGWGDEFEKLVCPLDFWWGASSDDGPGYCWYIHAEVIDLTPHEFGQKMPPIEYVNIPFANVIEVRKQ